jgi:hypothetical protein
MSDFDDGEWDEEWTIRGERIKELQADGHKLSAEWDGTEAGAKDICENRLDLLHAWANLREFAKGTRR